jgi:hypothetical protein
MSDYSYNKKNKLYKCKKCKTKDLSLGGILDHLYLVHNLSCALKVIPKGKKGYEVTIVTKKDSMLGS